MSQIASGLSSVRAEGRCENRRREADGGGIPSPMELRIKQLRRERGLSQEQLAERAGLSRTYLSQIETGARAPNIARLQQIARALGAVVPDLLLNPERDTRIIRLLGAMESASPQEWDAIIQHAEALRAAHRLSGDGIDNE